MGVGATRSCDEGFGEKDDGTDPMSPTFARIFFIVGTLLYIAIRFSFVRQSRQVRVAKIEREGLEKRLLFIAFLGTIVLPLTYLATGILSFADSSFSPVNAWFGLCLWIASTGVFWKSHKDLGLEWSPVLAMREDHQLITRGVYRRLRHPMYASIWGFVIAQAFLLPNWVAGFSGIVAFAILFFSRIKAEEQMLQRHFGPAYDAYRESTGGVVPKWRRRSHTEIH
jgi:protein-S-isoprenylcysteine O-methyltransferase Ste14